MRRASVREERERKQATQRTERVSERSVREKGKEKERESRERKAGKKRTKSPDALLLDTPHERAQTPHRIERWKVVIWAARACLETREIVAAFLRERERKSRG